ncbi:MAG: hypothetical protein J6B04_05615 [Clostridia bacterium]|nr:hypothetical protein [Clostridia bacterium]
MTSKTKKLLATITCCAIGLSACAAGLFAASFKQDKLITINRNYSNGFSIVAMADELDGTAAALHSEHGPIRRLTATTELNVTWAVEWLTPESDFALNKDVDDYITVTPVSETGHVVDVTCLQSFENEVIKITATEDGGAKAYITATFSGKPHNIAIVTNIEESSTAADGAFTALDANSTYTFDINLTNSYGIVGEQYSEFNVAVEGFGSFIMNGSTYSGLTGMTTPSTVTLSYADRVSDFVTANVVNGKLEVVTKTSIKVFTYSETSDGTDAGLGVQTTTYTFNSWDTSVNGDKACYALIRVTEKVTGITTQLKVILSGDVTPLEVDQSEVDF